MTRFFTFFPSPRPVLVVVRFDSVFFGLGISLSWCWYFPRVGAFSSFMGKFQRRQVEKVPEKVIVQPYLPAPSQPLDYFWAENPICPPSPSDPLFALYIAWRRSRTTEGRLEDYLSRGYPVSIVFHPISIVFHPVSIVFLNLLFLNPASRSYPSRLLLRRSQLAAIFRTFSLMGRNRVSASLSSQIK